MTHTDTASAVVGAVPELVFAALLDAQSRARWLPPRGMTGRFEHWDARPGGGYRLVLTYDDPGHAGKSGDNTDVVSARFLEIDPLSRVVEAVDFVSEDEALAGTMTMTWLVDPDPEGSLVTITADDVPDAIAREDHLAAFASTLAQLDGYVRVARPGGR